MKKHLLMKTLLVALVCLVGGTSSVWADGNKRVLNSQNYESAATVDWSAPNIVPVIADDGAASYIHYAKMAVSGNGNRSTYKSVTFAHTAGSGYTTAGMLTAGYIVEFDMLMSGGNVKDRSEQQFIIPTVGPNLGTDATYTGTDYIFSLSQAKRDAASRITTWVINDLTNTSETTATLNFSQWYHYILVVSASSVEYTIKQGSTTVATGNKTVTSLPTISGFFGLLGRGSGLIQFDNLEIYDYVDAEIVTAPSISVAYAGDNRTVTITDGTSSKGNTVTTYYTTNGDTPTSSSTAYTGAINITENCTVKAITISSADVSSAVESTSVTVGKLTLNAPTFTKTGYSAGKYTVSIASNQSSLDFVPGTTTLRYRIGNTGEFTTYSAPVEVIAGKVLYAYAEATNYTNSATVSVGTICLPDMTEAFSQNFVGVVDADLAMGVSAGNIVSNAISTAEANYFIPSTDGTNALTNDNISFYFNYNSGDTSQNKYWTLKPAGMYSAFGRGSANVKISNLEIGQIVKIDCSSIDGTTGLSKLDAYCSGTTNYYVATATSASMTLSRYQTIYSISVYNLDNEIVGAVDMSTDANAANSQDYTLRPGNSMKFTFKNHGTTYGNNWRISVKEGSTWKANVGADSYDYTANAATKTSYTMSTNGGSTKVALDWDRYAEDMADATVEATLNYVGGTLELVTKSTGTANGYIYYVDQDVTGLTAAVTVNLSVNHSWLEILSATESVTVTSAGYATYVSGNNLDFTSTGIKAYTAKVNGASKSVVMTQINKVPASTPVILYKEGGATENVPVATTTDTPADNDLIAGTGVAVATDGGGGKINYILNNVSGIGFYKAAGQIVAANRAYLQTTVDAAAARMTMIFEDDDVTGVNEVRSQKEDVRSEWFDLQGRKVAQPQKGLYIVNGKKVVLK